MSQQLFISVIKHSYSKDVCVNSVNTHIKADIFCGEAISKFGATVSGTELNWEVQQQSKHNISLQ